LTWLQRFIWIRIQTAIDCHGYGAIASAIALRFSALEAQAVVSMIDYRSA